MITVQNYSSKNTIIKNNQVSHKLPQCHNVNVLGNTLNNVYIAVYKG